MQLFLPALLSLAPMLAPTSASLGPATVQGGASEPAPLEATLDEVTVYGQSALVRRSARAPGDGTFVLQGLPRAIDPNSVRVRCTGGDVVSVEVRDRLQDAEPSPRLRELNERLEALQRELAVLKDEEAVVVEVAGYLSRLLKQEAEAQKGELNEGRPDPDAWRAHLEFVTGGMTENRARARDVRYRIEAKVREINELQVEIGRFHQPDQVAVRDVVVELVNAQGGADLRVDTFVHGTGWAPVYDLRTAADLSGVELVYRASVWQQTGEDWGDVDLLLSTARPQMGAQGPDPSVVWVDLYDPRQRKPASTGPMRGLGYAEDAIEAEASDYMVGRGVAASAVPVMTSVEQEGLSVRFRLPRKETIESRGDPTTVLVGRAQLAIETERSCVPALDPTVWLRAMAENTSDWTLLPGRAAVFFGDDFLGHSQVETIQPGQELTLHLGPDPGLTVEREVIDDERQKPGFLSSRGKRVESWRLSFENHGTVGTRPDGSVTVFVRESLPRSRDDRVKVELTKATPSVSGAERWKQDRDEKSILTWDLRVPRGGSADIVYETTISYPNGMEIVKRR